MKKSLYLVIVLGICLLSSCSERLTRGGQYPTLYQEQPQSIAIMPPINQTNIVEAKEFFFTTLHYPLAEKGYYVFSPTLTLEFFQNEGANDSEMFIDGDVSIFNKALGCDALMFTTIKSWKKNIFGAITVGVEYKLRSTKTGETLFHRDGLITLDTSVSGTGNAFVDLAATMIATALTDKVEAGRYCNLFCLADLPVGTYHQQYNQDKEMAAQKFNIKGTAKKGRYKL